MPKMKTHRGAAKRFKKTANGSYKFRRANRAHILTKKSTKRLRGLRGTQLVAKQDTRSIRRMLAQE